ncbi:GDSL family lipase, partial [Cellulomonas septica]|nr:GDSL family lipase [Cellulomonas septica]
ALGAPYVPTVGPLLDDPVWRAEVSAGDGAHPGAAGYERLAALVGPSWDALVDGLTS